MLGLWVGMAAYSCNPSAWDCNESGAKTAFALLGGGQLLGAALLARAYISQSKTLVRNDSVANISVVPMRLGKSGSGLGIAGTF